MLWRFTGRYLTATGRCPDGDGGNNLLAAFYIQTDAKDLNVMYHNAKVATNNLKLGTFGAFDNEWHTLAFRFAGNNSLQVTPVIDGQVGTRSR
ncbi:DUF6645 domain-containing protein [Escherichia coli]|uniref:DUF6645 domain-containing protein n=1 Tax=Escherichia coli TaxID=562 RepID=UPI00397DF2BE